MDRRSFIQGAAGAAVGTLLASSGNAAPADKSIFEVFETKRDGYRLNPFPMWWDFLTFEADTSCTTLVPSMPFGMFADPLVGTCMSNAQSRMARLYARSEGERVLHDLLRTLATHHRTYPANYYPYGRFIPNPNPFGPLAPARRFGLHRFVCHPKSSPRVRQVVGPQAPIHVSEHMPENIVFGVSEPEKLGTCYWHGDRVALVLRDFDGGVGFTLS